MAVSMGLTVDFSDSVGYVNYADHDLTDIENDEDYAYTPTAFQPVLPRSCKRTYGVFLGSEVVLERKLRSRMHGQLEQLRAVIPNSFTEEKASILADAYKYIEKLQRQVEELYYELGTESCFEEGSSCCEDDFSLSHRERTLETNADSESSSGSEFGYSQPTVKVRRTKEGLNIHIECDKRPGLLVDIMELLESRGLNMEQASIVCVEQLVFDGIGSEDEGSDAGVNRQAMHVSAEELGASLRSLISGPTQSSTQ
ncbi:transcription factor SCREAM2 [Physcomitrium patens]|uniref:BHLH domain-containing protein n=1 Tax=Physcomitrium patens TaxID=3218 RepID=A0A2K1IM61_PHYPA|nr:transcription factor SCREAM2-like [Physcomitrium patens]PNR30364.1 hypothetical protein PHYPA_026680 [Physcomitrium patens]|eukprot:XP_024360345.1 transcription factor SCREAM2-like [Physcomitrella patens]